MLFCRLVWSFQYNTGIICTTILQFTWSCHNTGQKASLFALIFILKSQGNQWSPGITEYNLLNKITFIFYSDKNYNTRNTPAAIAWNMNVLYCMDSSMANEEHFLRVRIVDRLSNVQPFQAEKVFLKLFSYCKSLLHSSSARSVRCFAVIWTTCTPVILSLRE